MPKIVGGVPPFIGTQDNLTIYLMNGEYIIRTKSSLTGKRVKRDPAFAKTMKYAGWLKQGARIASRIYRQLPNDKRVYKRYRELTGKAMLLLKEGFDTGDVITMLEVVYLPQPVNGPACKRNRMCGCKRVKSTGKCNSKCNGKCAKGYEYKYAHEYMLPYYCFGDPPQRAVQMGITGLSFLKYADVTDRGLIELPKPIRPPMLNSNVLQKTTASDPTCNRELEGQHENHCQPIYSLKQIARQ